MRVECDRGIAQIPPVTRSELVCYHTPFGCKPLLLATANRSLILPSFDFVSDVDLQHIDDAVNVVSREVSQRFDFRGSKSSIALDRSNKKIQIIADDELKMRAIKQLLEQKMAKRNLDLRCLQYQKESVGNQGLLKQEALIKDSLSKEEAKQIAKIIKDSKLKIQTQIQDQQLRVSGKKIDNLQEAIALVENAQMPFPVRPSNMRD
ncbi:MAG: YajQ family cyclic di-GMP-binding protein [Pseudomonadota bacterium]|nr:YajQ family cyclic di-GMP-binding protein [Pseudomonadota bacterium]